VKSRAGCRSMRLVRCDDECDIPFARGLFSPLNGASSRLVPNVARPLNWNIDTALRFNRLFGEDYSTRRKAARSQGVHPRVPSKSIGLKGIPHPHDKRNVGPPPPCGPPSPPGEGQKSKSQPSPKGKGPRVSTFPNVIPKTSALSPLGERVARRGVFISRGGTGEGVQAQRAYPSPSLSNKKLTTSYTNKSGA